MEADGCLGKEGDECIQSFSFEYCLAHLPDFRLSLLDDLAMSDGDTDTIWPLFPIDIEAS